MSVNKWIGIGNVGGDPEIHTFDNGNKKASFSLATSETFKNREGTQETVTQWHSIIVFGKLTDLVEKWITKGKQLYIEGKVTYRTYQDKDGNRKGATEIIADTIRFVGGKTGGETITHENKVVSELPEPDNVSNQEPGEELPF